MPTSKKTTAKAAPKKAAKTPKVEAAVETPVVAAKVEKSAPVKDLSKIAKVASPKAEKSSTKVSTPAGEYIYAAGNRKTCVARVRLYTGGTGAIVVNEKKLEEYIVVPSKRDAVKSPLRLTGHLTTFDISVKTSGGGLGGQAEAIRHGISKALLAFDPSLRITLKRAGMLTRDPRMKERKKPGLHRARRAPQWSKR